MILGKKDLFPKVCCRHICDYILFDYARIQKKSLKISEDLLVLQRPIIGRSSFGGWSMLHRPLYRRNVRACARTDQESRNSWMILSMLCWWRSLAVGKQISLRISSEPRKSMLF